MGAYVPTENIIEDIKRITQELGYTPLMGEYVRLGKYSDGLVRSRLGNWAEALEKCGLSPSPASRPNWTNTDLDEEIERLEKLLGHKPSWRDINAHSKISASTFDKRLGKTCFNEARNPGEWSIDSVSDSDGYWIAGFTNGEGSFILRSNYAVFSITQRSDDIGVMQYIANVFGTPDRLYTSSNDKRRQMGQKVGDEVKLSINNRQILRQRVIPFFTKFKLRGRKAMEFEIFKNAVHLLCNRDDRGLFHQKFSPEDRAMMDEYNVTIKALRRDPTAHQPTPQPLTML